MKFSLSKNKNKDSFFSSLVPSSPFTAMSLALQVSSEIWDSRKMYKKN